MLGKLLRNEEIDAGLVLALSGAIVVLVANGPRPVSLGRVVAGALSNPVPVRGAGGTRGGASVAGRRIAA